MAGTEEKIRFLKEIREHPEKYLPMTDHAWKQFAKVDYGENWYDDPWYNIGWDAGLAEGNRPYFLIGWATCGITILTYYLSTEGIREYGTAELLAMLVKAKLVRILDPERASTSVMVFTDASGNEFFSINIVLGDEEGTYVGGGKVFPFGPLNRFNRERQEEGKNDDGRKDRGRKEKK